MEKDMNYVLVLLATINGNVYPSPGWYYPTLEECQKKGTEMVVRAQPTERFKLAAMCFEVRR
jgi:hypothetical protein